MKNKNKRNILIISLVFLLVSIIFYGYYCFFVPTKFYPIFHNWDGPSYVVIAKSFYNVEIISQINNQGVKPIFFAAHFPLYPVFIRLFSFMGYSQSMVFVSQLFSLLFIIAFYFLGLQLKLKNPLILSIVAIFLTPRWFIVSHVGSSEPLFLFLLTLCLIFISKKNYWLAAIFAFLAQLTRAQSILIFVGIGFYVLYELFTKKQKLGDLVKTYFPFVLIPLGLILVFLIYLVQFGNFFAFFTAMSEFKHLQFPPFAVFSHFNPIVSGWKEIYIYEYFIYLIAFIHLISKPKMRIYGFIFLAFYIPILFLIHEDISRYSLPLLPFVFIIFDKFFTSKKTLITLAILLPAIFAFSINYTLLNLSP